MKAKIPSSLSGLSIKTNGLRRFAHGLVGDSRPKNCKATCNELEVLYEHFVPPGPCEFCSICSHPSLVHGGPTCLRRDNHESRIDFALIGILQGGKNPSRQSVNGWPSKPGVLIHPGTTTLDCDDHHMRIGLGRKGFGKVLAKV